MSYHRIPEQRLHLMWGVGSAFASYALVAGLSRGPSKLVTGGVGQLFSGTVVGSIAGSLFAMKRHWDDHCVICQQYQKNGARHRASTREFDLINEEWGAIDKAWETVGQQQAAINERYKLLIQQDVENANVEEQEDEIELDDSKEKSNTPLPPTDVTKFEAKIEFSWRKRFEAIAAGSLVGGALSAIATRIGQGGVLFGQNAMDVGSFWFSVGALFLLRVFHLNFVRHIDTLNKGANQLGKGVRVQRESWEEIDRDKARLLKRQSEIKEDQQELKILESEQVTNT